jgi:hypothetical protein
MKEQVTELRSTPPVEADNLSVEHSLALIGRNDCLPKFCERIEWMTVAGSKLTLLPNSRWSAFNQVESKRYVTPLAVLHPRDGRTDALLTCKLATVTCWNNGLGIFTAELVSGTLGSSRLLASMCNFEQPHHDVQDVVSKYENCVAVCRSLDAAREKRPVHRPRSSFLRVSLPERGFLF